MPAVAVEHCDRRQKRRLPIRVEVSYLSIDEFLQDVATNISIGGVFIQTDEPLKENTRFRLQFSLPGEERPIAATGEVCWVADPDKIRSGRVAGMGIRFADISDTDRNRIRRWLGEDVVLPPLTLT